MSKPIVSFDELALKDELRELVGKTIEKTINVLFNEKAAYRAGYYERGFTATSRKVTLKMLKLQGMRFVVAVIKRYKRCETSLEEAISRCLGQCL